MRSHLPATRGDPLRGATTLFVVVKVDASNRSKGMLTHAEGHPRYFPRFCRCCSRSSTMLVSPSLSRPSRRATS